MHTFLNVLGALDRAQQEALNRCLLLRYQCSGSSAGSEWRQALFLLKPPVQLTMGSWPMSGSATSKKGPSAAEGTCLQSGQSTCMASTDEPLNARVAHSQQDGKSSWELPWSRLEGTQGRTQLLAACSAASRSPSSPGARSEKMAYGRCLGPRKGRKTAENLKPNDSFWRRTVRFRDQHRGPLAEGTATQGKGRRCRFGVWVPVLDLGGVRFGVSIGGTERAQVD